MRTQSIFVMTMFLVLMFCGLMSVVEAEETHWIGTTGDWFDANNWMYKVPGSDDLAVIDNGGTAEITSGLAEARYIYVSHYDAGSGNINHSGGILDVFEIYIGYGHPSTYNLSGTAQLSASNRLFVGYYWNGQCTFNQTGGSNIANGNGLIVGSYGGDGIYDHSGGIVTASYVCLGDSSGSIGTYNLSATGALSSTGGVTVGREATGIFIQNGGTSTLGGNMVLGDKAGSLGRYAISGGTLSAQELRVGHFGSGQFDIEDSPVFITVSDLFFNSTSIFTSVPGSIIRMTGSSLDNWSSDPNDLLGFNHLTLIFEGGSGGVSTLEVACEDMGPIVNAFDKNFALDGLTIGDPNVVQMQLVDNRNNSDGTDCLYVKDLVLGNSSSLDLNGLNLYCLSLVDNGGVVYLNGGQLIQLPSGTVPVTLTLRVDPNDAGIETVSPGVGSFGYFTGQHVGISAEDFVECPNVFRFDHWEGEVADVDAENTVVFMGNDKTVTAVFVDNRQCGDQCHPYPSMDHNQDCIVDFKDFALFSQSWLECTKPECD